MIRTRTIRLFLTVNGVKCFWLLLLLLLVGSKVVERALSHGLPNWFAWVLLIGISVSGLGLVLIMQVIQARQVTGFPSLVLLWEFWRIDAAYRKMPRTSQQVAFKRHFGRLTPAAVDGICRDSAAAYRRK